MKFCRVLSIAQRSVSAVALTFTLGWLPAQAQSRPHIQREQIESMFSTMRAKAPWNVDGPLLWGYLFFYPSREKLEQAASELESKDYRIVGIAPARGGVFRLHIERIETHTPASLDTRNQDFYALAERYGIALYDGMDVGPAEAPGKK